MSRVHYHGLHSTSELSVDDIASSWRIVKFGQNSPKVSYILEPKDKAFLATTHNINMTISAASRGLGLDLVEYQVGEKDSSGLVLISDIN